VVATARICLRGRGFESPWGHVVNHLGPFGDVLVINDNCLWTNDSSRNKNAGLDGPHKTGNVGES
jgi:hypothetical protein